MIQYVEHKENVMKILVTGGTTFVSRYTAEFFVRQGHDVLVLNRGTKTQSNGVYLIKADRHDLGDTLRLHKFDVVIDVTSYTGVDVSDLLDGLGEFGKYILISSSAVYPETLQQPFSEDQPCGPNIHWGAYGTNKIEAEQTLLQRVPDAYIIRPPYLYGPMNNLYREAYIFDCAEKNVPVYIPENMNMQLHFYHVRDLCMFIEKLIDTTPAEHIFNVGNSETVSIREWVTECFKVFGKTPEFVKVNSDIPVRTYFPFRDYEYILDVTKQNAILKPSITLEKGLSESYLWYKDHGKDVLKKDYFTVISEKIARK